MTASPTEASAFVQSATTAGERMRDALVPARGGLMSVEDAAELRAAVEAFETLQAEGERLADELHRPWFTAWVEDMRARGRPAPDSRQHAAGAAGLMPIRINPAVVDAARQRLADAPRRIMAAVAVDLVQNTPVRAGWLRASWTVTVEGVAMDGAPAAPDPDGAATVARLVAEIAAAPDGAKVSFRNVAPYCAYVEFGTSKMAPQAFIRGTIARIPAIAAEVASRPVTA